MQEKARSSRQRKCWSALVSGFHSGLTLAMDALSARVAGLPSGSALFSTLKASVLPPDAQEAVAAAVVAVLAEASAGGAFFCLRWVCVGFAPRWKDWHPLAAARGRVYRCAARNMSSLACMGDIGVAITFRRCARIVSLALSLARAPSAASTFPLSPSPSNTQHPARKTGAPLRRPHPPRSQPTWQPPTASSRASP